MKKVRAWNVYSIKPENARIVASTDHEGTVTEALDAAAELAYQWNQKESRSDMVVTSITCCGFIRTIPVQMNII